MDVEQYLKRINCTGTVSPTFECLVKLQQQHLLNVPFENLDIHNNTRIDLDNLFDKIVVRKRGGFCYELNKLFCDLLKKIGFDVKIISARVYSEGTYSPEYDHMALLVQLVNERYLVDVGFGEFAFNPISLIIDKEVNDPRGIFRINNVDDVCLVVEKRGDDRKFIPEYLFSEKERQLEEFYGMCDYHQTNPASHFMQKTICSLPTKTGRITLTGNKLKVTENGETSEKVFDGEEQIKQLLWSNFGIKI